MPPDINEFIARTGLSIAELQDPELMALVDKELERMILAEAVRDEKEQEEAAHALKFGEPQRAIDGVGAQVLNLSQGAFLHYKQVEKFDFSSKRDRNWLVNRFPEMRVPGRQTVRNTVGFVGRTESRKQKVEIGPEVRPVHDRPRNIRSTTKFSTATKEG